MDRIALEYGSEVVELDADDNIMHVAVALAAADAEDVTITPSGLGASPANEYNISACDAAGVDADDYAAIQSIRYYVVGTR